MMDLEEQRVCVKFCFKFGKTVTETWKMLQQAFGDECMSRTQCFEWYSRFKTGTSIDEDSRSGRPSTSTDDVHIDAVLHLILQNRRLTIREIVEDIGISFGSCQAILTEKLIMQRVAAKFVPRVLTEDQKANRVNISQELLHRVSVEENFLKTIVTGDEIWVYGYDIETKAQSSQWVGQGSPRPKKARMSRPDMNVMLLVFFDWQGIIHHEFDPRGQRVNTEFYVAVLKRLREAVRRKRPQLWTNQSWVLHHDNAPAHSSCLVRNFLAKNETTVVPQTPYSPDLVPADFFLFPKLKSTLKGRCFDTIDEILKNSMNELFTIPKEAFQKAFQSWQKRWERCVASKGNYFEGDKLE